MIKLNLILGLFLLIIQNTAYANEIINSQLINVSSNLDGNDKSLFYPMSEWSDDGNKIIYISDEGVNIYYPNSLNNEKIKSFKNCYKPEFLSGNTYAFLSENNNYFSLEIYSFESSKAIKIIKNVFDYYYDSETNQIFFINDKSVSKLNLKNLQISRITDFDQESLLVSGKSIVLDKNKNIYYVKALNESLFNTQKKPYYPQIYKISENIKNNTIRLDCKRL